MSVFAEKDRFGRPSGIWVVKVMREGRVFTHRTRDHKEARHIEARLKAGLTPDAKEAPSAQESRTLRWLLPHAIGLYEGTKDYRQSAQRCEEAFIILGLSKSIVSIRTPELDQLVSVLKRRGLNNKTINRYLAPVSKALQWCWERDYIPGKPKIPRVKEDEGRVAFVSETNEPKLLDWIEKRDADIALVTRVLLVSGFRITELLSRRPSDLEHGWLRLWTGETKNDDARAAYLGDLAVPLAALLVSGLPTYRDILDTLRDASIALGIPHITPHVLRHTTATRLDAYGHSTARIKKYMGHRSVNTTLKYIHVEKDAIKEAAESLTKRQAKLFDNRWDDARPIAINSPVLQDFLNDGVQDTSEASGEGGICSPLRNHSATRPRVAPRRLGAVAL